MNCIILGDRSDIAKSLSFMLSMDAWTVQGWNRDTRFEIFDKWDLILIALGRVAPVGKWETLESWDTNFRANVSLGLELLRRIWSWRKTGASVCFMAGSNPQKIMPGYAPYNASKMALLKVCEQLDFETPDVKFFALGPGYVDTKIHNATKEANWPNERIARGNSTPIEKIYDCLKWCISQPKEVVGGRNICVSDGYGPELAERLKANPSLFKLRRIE